MIKDLKHSQWLFTCSMTPEQFGQYDELNPDDYDDGLSSDWLKYDSFTTTKGSSHSQCNCGCKLISEEYAKWFLDNNIHELYDRPEGNIAELNDKAWEEYVIKVKTRCKENNIKYEGV